MKQAIRYSNLRFIKTPYKGKGKHVPRVWFLEQHSILADLKELYKVLNKRFNKPRTIRIKKIDIVIGVLLLIALWPSQKPHKSIITAQVPIHSSIAKKLPEVSYASQSEVQSVYVAPVAPVAPSGSCSDWLAEAGIAETVYVDDVINFESGCNPNALNPSSGACGIGQMINGCDTYDPVQQLIEMNTYVLSRYGDWATAWQHELDFNWY